MKKLLFILPGLALILALGAFLFFQQPKFGKLPEGSYLEQMEKSPHYLNGQFENLEPVPEGKQSGNKFVNWAKIYFAKKERVVPTQAIPSVKTDLKNLAANQDVAVWLGHSSYFLKLSGKNILVDPVFSDYAAPFFLINRAFSGTNIYTAEDMPEIDYLLLTHDHWDHLDYASVIAIKDKVANVICPLGVGGYFEQWGYGAEIIQEGDWFDIINPEAGLDVHFLPARHYSGRLLTRNKTLWTAFALITPERRIFLSGDSGYGSHFTAIGEQFGGFDLALLDMGQYNDNWHYIHMNPEEAAQVAVEVNAKALLPIHIGKFSMAYHEWDEPFERIVKASKDKPYKLLTPMLGEVVELKDNNQVFRAWWKNIKE